MPKRFNLQNGEYINNVTARTGGHVDCLVIHTNKGREFTAGGSGGGARNCNVPSNCMVIALGGGTNGHLHNFNCTYVDLSKLSP